MCQLPPRFAESSRGEGNCTVELLHGVFSEPNFTENPCTGSAITSFDAFGNVVDHVTFFLEDNQMTEVWATFTETGKVTITDAAGVT
jgi:hypothetical protein